MDSVEVEDQVSMAVHDHEAPALDSDGESSSCSSSEQFGDFVRIGMVRLEEDEGEFSVVKKSLLEGMRIFGNVIDVVAVHKNSYSSVSGQARKEAFRIYGEAVAARRGGDANVKYGWYGGSRDEICDVVSYGFGKFGDVEKGNGSHGVGVYLSPANVPIDSALRANEDENGVRHMLLCRVILGNSETIPEGSKQSYPSSDHFDSGIDSPLAPRKYIIWSSHMNSHIFPNYIISFKAPSLTGSGQTRNFARKTNPPGMKFSMLFNVLSRFLHSSKTALISNYYNDFRERKIDRSELIRRLRNLVDDKMLISAIKLCRDEIGFSAENVKVRIVNSSSSVSSAA